MSEKPKPCPICGRQPDVDACGGHNGPWYANCYLGGNNEHFIGVNGDDRADTIREWNKAVDAHRDSNGHIWADLGNLTMCKKCGWLKGGKKASEQCKGPPGIALRDNKDSTP